MRLDGSGTICTVTNHSTSDPIPHRLETPVGTVTVAVEGDAGEPAILCVHGLPGSSRDFRYLGPLLSTSFRIARLEMPGFGAAPAGATASIDGWATLIHAAADALGFEHFILLAHSFGGGAAILAASALTGRVYGLVLIASMGIRPHRALTRPLWIWKGLAMLMTIPPARPLVIRAARRGYRTRHLPFPSDWHDLHRQLRLTGSIDFHAIRKAAPNVTSPAFIFQARDDPLVEPEIAAGLERSMPNAALHMFETGGHHLQKTRAPDIAAVILHEFQPPDRVSSQDTLDP